MVAAPAQAVVTDTFAQFVQLSTTSKIFKYVNVLSGPNKATFSSAGANTVFLSDIGTLASPSIATVGFSAVSTALPTVGPTTTTQLFSGSLTFTLLVPQVGLHSPIATNALTVSFTNAALKAEPGTSAPTLQADTDAGSTITYSSDFYDFSGFVAADFSLSFSGASKPLNLVGGRLPDFNASGSGTFAGAGAVPEPASWAMMFCGFGAMGTILRSRRKATVAFG
jgi:hypothetical protein